MKVRLIITILALVLSTCNPTPVPAQSKQSPFNQPTITVDMGDGYIARPVIEMDQYGFPVTYVNVLFPVDLMRNQQNWLPGVRTASIKMFGCEAFRDCTPAYRITSYEGLAVTATPLRNSNWLLAYFLVKDIRSKRVIGASFRLLIN